MVRKSIIDLYIGEDGSIIDGDGDGDGEDEIVSEIVFFFFF